MTANGRDNSTRNHAPERFAPLLRELMRVDLVQRTDTGSWILRDDVQRVLESYSSRRAPAEVYVGHRCQGCGNTTVTRESGGRYLCAACIGAREAGEDTVAPSEPEVHGRGKLRFLPRRRAG